jgi:ribonuclease J
MQCSDELFKPLNALRHHPPEKTLILTTGSQGEPLAALTRIANGSHRHVQVQQGDTVVFSANPIPGNTIAVVNTIDKLMMKGANVVYGKRLGIHVSGHGAQEDQKLMLALTRPKFFLPVHGEHRMLVKHAQTAQNMGIPAENMVIIQNGDVVELTEDSIQIGGQVPSGIELVDSSRRGMVADDVLRERQQLAEDGVITVATSIGWDGKLVAPPAIHMRGVATTIEKDKLARSISNAIDNVLADRWREFAQDFEDDGGDVNWVGLQTQIETELSRFLKRELRSRPSLVFIMQPLEKPEVQTRTRRRRSTAVAAS